MEGFESPAIWTSYYSFLFAIQSSPITCEISLLRTSARCLRMCIALLQVTCVLLSNYLPPSWVLNSDIDCPTGFVVGHCWPPPFFNHDSRDPPPQPYICTLPYTARVYLYIPVIFTSVSFIISKLKWCCPCGVIWQCLETSLVVTPGLGCGAWPQASSRWGGQESYWMSCDGQLYSQQRISQFQMLIALRLRNTDLGEDRISFFSSLLQILRQAVNTFLSLV